MVDFKKQGRLNKQAGAAWEKKVRINIEENNWFVSKFQNTVEFNIEFQGNAIQEIPDEVTVGKLIHAKNKFLGPGRPIMLGAGFPDFIAFRWGIDGCNGYADVIGVECKINGYLKPEEKEKCEWLLENKVFSKILIAKKKKEGSRVVPEYIDFKTKEVLNWGDINR